MTKPKRKTRPPRAQTVQPTGEPPVELAQGGAATFAASFRFARQLTWQFELLVEAEQVVIYLVHVSHMKADAPPHNPPPALVEQMSEPTPSTIATIPRAAFINDEQIREWFTQTCAAFEDNLLGVLAFEIDQHFGDLIRFQLDLHGIRRHDKNRIIREHINGTKGEPRRIGTREFLQILLAARGPSNKSPANEFNLPTLINTALRNLRPTRLLTYEGVNDFFKRYFRLYASADGEALRKLCKRCGVDFMAFVREERERRKAEN